MPLRRVKPRTSRKRKLPSPSESEESEDERPAQHLNNDQSDEDASGTGSELEDDADAPRASRWADSDEDTGSDDDDPGPGDPESSLRKELSSLSFGALLKARSAKSAEADTSESSSEDDASAAESDEDSDSDDGPSKPPEKKIIDKRSNKHAPIEVTSKKPVGRFRPVVEGRKSQVRDPRFVAGSGGNAPDQRIFQKAYSFLPEMHVQELATLRENLTRARKLLSSTPRDLRAEREAEVQRLEAAVRRLEGVVQREHRQQVEQAALDMAMKAEKEKRKQGKGQWFMKNSEKKSVMLKARYDDLAASGKRGAVQKAIEKKQRKIAQKEKKSRPFAPPPKPGGSHGQQFNSSSESRPNKRQKFA